MERPNSKGANNFVVGMFVFVSLLVVAGFIVFMGGSSVFQGEYKLKVRLEDARGLNIGAPVFLSGLLIGRVATKDLPNDSPNGIDVTVTVSKDYKERIRSDSEATTSTTGMLGDQVIVISPGTDAFPELQPGDYVKTKIVKKLEDYLADGGNAVENLNKAAFHLSKLLEGLTTTNRLDNILKNIEVLSGNMSQQLSGSKKDNLGPALVHLESILKKIDKGDGTLGALVNDPTLHEDLRILLGGAKRSKILRYLVREAISKSEVDSAASKTEQ